MTVLPVLSGLHSPRSKDAVHCDVHTAWAALCHAVLCCAVLCFDVLCCAVLCCAVLCCAVLCCTLLSHAVLCYAVLCCSVLHQAVCKLRWSGGANTGLPAGCPVSAACGWGMSGPSASSRAWAGNPNQAVQQAARVQPTLAG